MSYVKLPAFILGFHGCDEETKRKLLLGEESLNPSNNCYDWLGSGIYFWENDPDRAFAWAESIVKNPNKCVGKINIPAVVGAVIDLGYCLNLFEQESLLLVKESYKMFTKNTAGPLPENKGRDFFLRNLDCAVINFLHQYRADNSKNGVQEFDSVRAPFWEGNPLYPGAGFREKNHIQICIRNPKCIKGYFDPLNQD